VTEEADIVVVGLGVGGEEVGGKLAEAGLSVVGIERRLVGGECPYWGCIPSKMMIRAANLLAETRRVDGMAGHATATPDWAPVAKRIRDEATDNWDDQVAVDRFVGKGGTFVRGSATFTAPDTVEVDGRSYRARRGIVISVGTTATIPPIDGLADTPYWTNKQAIETETVPSSLICLGGGAIGLELAQAFARFGAKVTIIEAADRLIAMEEPESSELAAKALAADGVAIHTGTAARRISHDGSQFTVHVEGGEPVTGDKLLVAVGRRSNFPDLGLDAAGLDANAPIIGVDDRMRAGDKLWAIGDITGHGAFTHLAMYQASIVIRDILDQDGPPADYKAVPHVTFTDPEIGSVGLSEKQARDAGVRVRTAITQIPSSTRGWIHKAGNDGFIKLVADADRGVLVGATSAGPVGGEVLSALVVAVKAEVPISTLRAMIYAYPTFHRAIEDALSRL
jgi:pyruvate/2-oxoglutarate dehydrogenase complex dihydrolipoamide dehydrogenase (E3) component